MELDEDENPDSEPSLITFMVVNDSSQFANLQLSLLTLSGISHCQTMKVT